jgi:hypothetical protein
MSGSVKMPNLNEMDINYELPYNIICATSRTMKSTINQK